MQKGVQIMVSYLLGLIFFAFFTLIAHLKPAGGLDTHLLVFDYVNLLNLILLYPFARNGVRKWRLARRAHKNTDSRGFIRRGYDEHGESFAQMEYNSAWASQGAPNGGSALVPFALYGVAYIFAVVIDVVLLIRMLVKRRG
ncbi:MAG TPA: hypothetical protein DCW31_08115 [Lactobacillus sp.]|nr:hypothetical protein [Lactobacillus sp.]